MKNILSRPFQAPDPAKDNGHHGIDLAHYLYKDKTTIAGVPVQAILAGPVAAAIPDSWPYGNMLIIETPFSELPAGLGEEIPIAESQSLYHLYAHLEGAPVLEIGDFVQCGEAIGKVGNTGWSGNFHLHLETRLGPAGNEFSEMAYYQTTTNQSERENYEYWRLHPDWTLVDPFDVLRRNP